MSWGGPEFVLGIIAIATLGGILRTWIMAHHGLPVQHDEFGTPLRSLGERPEERMRVLERIATDRAGDVAAQIEGLRDAPTAQVKDEEFSR